MIRVQGYMLGDFFPRHTWGPIPSYRCVGLIFCSVGACQTVFVWKYGWKQVGHWRWCLGIKLAIWIFRINKANLRDLIAATGQVISNWIQIGNFSACVTMKFDGWPCKTIGHYITWSFVHHFKSIGEFKLNLQSRNAQFGSKFVIYYPVWPWNLMDDLGKQ